MRHKVRLVGDHELTADFMLVDGPDGVMCFYRQSTLTAQVIEAGWAAYDALIGMQETPDPERATPEPSKQLVALAPVACIGDDAQHRLMLVS